MQSPSAPARVRCALPALLLAAVSLPGCPSTSENSADAAPDGPPPPRVQRVNCPSKVAAEITEITLSPGVYDYSPKMTTVKAGAVVRFRSGEIHTTLSNPRGLFEVEYKQTECFKFNTKETHNFVCGAHGFTGSITVQ